MTDVKKLYEAKPRPTRVPDMDDIDVDEMDRLFPGSTDELPDSYDQQGGSVDLDLFYVEDGVL